MATRMLQDRRPVAGCTRNSPAQRSPVPAAVDDRAHRYWRVGYRASPRPCARSPGLRSGRAMWASAWWSPTL